MSVGRRDLAGQWFGDVEVLGEAGKTWDGRALWRCLCHACGRPWTMRGAVLTRTGAGQAVRSCGCQRAGRGETNPQATLTDAGAAAMRASWAAGGTSKTALARAHGVSRRLVGMILADEVRAG